LGNLLNANIEAMITKHFDSVENVLDADLDLDIDIIVPKWKMLKLAKQLV
jgi:hypothetical protein